MSLAMACSLACGASQRPAAAPDFRTLQVHEARVSELGARAQDGTLGCSERQGAAERCGAEVAQARADAEGVRDADLEARLDRLVQHCAAAAGTVHAQCADAQ
ncbi:MAG: hypothetical protein H6726_32050 [Sandaracinaceae bacterium]|nr:hypothetical protein [Sandaracinaceae bacterium]